MKLKGRTLLKAGLLLIMSVSHPASDDITVWREFVERLKHGQWSSEDIRPYDTSLTKAMIGFLRIIGENSVWEDFDKAPEVFRQGQRVHFLSTIRIGENEQSLCFTILLEEDRWYFQHMESIFVRMDKLDSLPATVFPDIAENQKAWVREEIRVSKQVRLFNHLVKMSGREFAFTWFKDGPGYFLSAKTWVPFLEPDRAFVLYLCWDLANLRGNKVVLEKLEDGEARVRLQLLYFQLYEHTAHLRNQIAFEDYRRLFETIWRDRALQANWDLAITYEGDECLFSFVRRR